MSKKQLLILTVRRAILSLIGVGVIAAMFWYVNTYIYKFYASNEVVKIDASTTTAKVEQGKSFTYNLVLSGQNIETADLYINFDTDKLQYSGTVVSVPPNYFKFPPDYSKATALSATQTQQRIILLATPNVTALSNVSLNLTFKAIKSGDATITVDPKSVITGTITGTDKTITATAIATDLQLATKKISITAPVIPNSPPTITSVSWTPQTPIVGKPVSVLIDGTDSDTNPVDVTVFVNGANIIEKKDVAVSNGKWTVTLQPTVPSITGKMSGYVQVTDGTNTIKSKVYDFTIDSGKKDLLLFWKMDEKAWSGARAVKDSSGMGNDGTATGAVPALGQYANGGSFDGSNDYVSSVNDMNLLNHSFTISFWLNPKTVANYNQSIGSINFWGAFGFHTTTDGSIYTGINANNTTGRFTPKELPANTVELNKWQYLTITYDYVGVGASNPAQFYKNGVLLASKKLDSGSKDWGKFIVGSSLASTINGKVDEVKVYNYVRTASEIKDDMNPLVVISIPPAQPPPWVNTDYTTTTVWGIVQGLDVNGQAYEDGGFWASKENVCENAYQVKEDMSVSGSILDQCQGYDKPYFITKVTNPGSNLSYELKNIPVGYQCDTWEHRLRVKSDGAPKLEESGEGCTTSPLNINVNNAASSYENSHFIFFKIKKIPTATPVPGSFGKVTLKLALKFQGIDSKPLGANTMDVNVWIADRNAPGSSGYKDTKSTFTVDDKGIWRGELTYDIVPLDKQYNIYIKGPKHLAKKICSTNPTEALPGTYSCSTETDRPFIFQDGVNEYDFSTIDLLAGDLPIQDGIVDARDWAFVRQNSGSTDKDVLSRGDLNLDGVVDSQDHTMIKTALEFKYDEE